MTLESLENTPLGKRVTYKEKYDKSLLCVIVREDGRSELSINKTLPFSGEDIWTAYELSWLNEKGKPVVAYAHFYFPCHSEGMIESKSFKLYLNSFNQSKFLSVTEVKNTLEKDLSSAVQLEVGVEMITGNDFSKKPQSLVAHFSGICLDELDISIDDYQVNPDLLKLAEKKEKPERSAEVSREELYSHLFRSNCPVTGQPDWASVFIRYSGPAIEKESVLKYLCSYRQHEGFHEQCVENIFCDLLERCQCDELTVEARFLRRGGLDINPFRTNCRDKPLLSRQLRQ